MTVPPSLVALPSQTVGPFFHFGLTTNQVLGIVRVPGVPGDPIQLRVRVLDGDGAPVPDALVEIFQADGRGAYARLEGPSPGAFSGFGRLPTDADGWCTFETVKPGAVSTGGAMQAPHVQVCLLSRGILRHLYTRIYFEGDAELAADPLLALVPSARRGTLLARGTAGSTWEIVLRMQGAGETVFFDF